MTDFRKCPTCGELAEGSCRCMRGDSWCKNGHKWHRCVKHQVIVMGHSDHGTDSLSCTCIGGVREEAKPKKEISLLDNVHNLNCVFKHSVGLAHHFCTLDFPKCEGCEAFIEKTEQHKEMIKAFAKLCNFKPKEK